MQDLIIYNEKEVIVQANGKMYRDMKEHFLADYGKTVEYEAIDYNRETQSCSINGKAFQKYPNELCENILNGIDTLLEAKSIREYVEPTPEEIQKMLTDGVQKWMDNKVQERNYDNVHTCVGTYLYSPIDKFRIEAGHVKDWVSYVWAKCYEILAQVKNGEREIPTLEEVINELPILDWGVE